MDHEVREGEEERPGERADPVAGVARRGHGERRRAGQYGQSPQRERCRVVPQRQGVERVQVVIVVVAEVREHPDRRPGQPPQLDRPDLVEPEVAARSQDPQNGAGEDDGGRRAPPRRARALSLPWMVR